MEAFFSGRAYAPHRHDTYAIGHTLTGVQSFNYRGAVHHSLPGRVIVLHPDERHDGRAGTDAGFRYRMLYIEPSLICAALGGGTLPFVRDAVSNESRLLSAVHTALADFDKSIGDLRCDELVLCLAEALDAASGGRRNTLIQIDGPAIARTRELLLDKFDKVVSRDELEIVSGLDRWTLTRQFRAACGTSPYRYLIMRRLERARALILAGDGLAEVAHATGFSDQSHMTRQFKKTYGMTPGWWSSLNTQLPN